jgi:SNF2-related domain
MRKPDAWVLPNRMGFESWIYQTFHPNHYRDGDPADTPKGLQSGPHQKLIRDLLTETSPYRGILLYHGLGVGKTRSSLLTAEDFIRHRKKIVVMLPASLQKNYRNEILMSSHVGRMRWKHWRKITLMLTTTPAHQEIYQALKDHFPIGDDFTQKYTQKASGKTEFWIPYIPNGVEVPESILSTPAPWESLTPKDHKTVAAIHEYFINHTFEFLNYNGLLKTHLTTKYKSDFFENKLVIIDEAHNFITQSMKEDNILAKLYQRLLYSKNVRLLLLSGTPVINRPVELAYLVNLLRGPVPTLTVDFGKRPMPSEEDLWKTLEATPFEPSKVPVASVIDTVEFSHSPKEKTLEVRLVPFGFAKTGPGSPAVQYQADLQWTPEEYRQRLQAAFETQFHVLKTKHRWENHLALPTDEKTFNALFVQEGEITNQRLFVQRSLGLVSYYKISTKNFPTMAPMVVRRVPLSEHQFVSYLHNRHDEQNMERKKKLRAIRRGGVVEDDGNNVYRTFSRMACNFVFPKAIPRHFPMSIRAAFREMDDASYKQDDDMEKKVEETYERERQAAMAALEAGGDHYLTQEALAAHYSPKMAQVLADLSTNPGKGLFYSQFREMEGIGIFALALQQAGWRPLDIRIREGGTDYEFIDPTVLDPAYDRKRFVVFNHDRTRSDILLKLFNGSAEWSQLPKEAQGLLKQLAARGKTDNLRGELAALMMISQSGAEGISLKEVRQVYILEPFWNQVRIDQVIGRASRTNSHAKLPPAERTVQVFLYVSTFTPAQIEKDHTMRHLDNEQTSDEHILQIAQRKKHIISQFENALKMAAIDCLNNAENNQTRADGLQCYMPPVDLKKGGPGLGAESLQYVPDMADHVKLLEQQAKRIRRTKVQGKRRKDAVQVRGRRYDAPAYENAGVLVPVPKKD